MAAVAGLAQAASLAWPWGGQPLWWLQWASMLALAWLVAPPAAWPAATSFSASASPAHPPRSWKRAAGVGWAFATAWLVGTFWWLFISMHTYGGLAAPVAVAAVLGLALFLGSYYAIVLGLFSRIVVVSATWSAIVFAALWLLAELARGVLWTGFPWGAGGYAHVDGPLAPLARSIGVYGVGAVSAALAMAVVQVLRTPMPGRQRLMRLAAGCVLLAGVLGAAAWQRDCAVGLCGSAGAEDPSATAAPLSLALLQGNIPQDEKFQAGSGVPLALAWYGQALREAEADLVVAPETAIPLLPQQLMPGYLEGIAAHFAGGASTGTGTGTPRAALLGIPLGSEAEGYTNSVWGLSPATAELPYRYDKHHLVPFGEFIPPFFRWFTEMMNIPLGDFNRGAVGQPSFVWAGQRIAPNICYEDLFGEELGARFADPAQAPTIFVNVSNIGWFGDSIAIDQHLQISRMRALEFERPMVRATNTGATAIIDHRAVVTHQLAPGTRGVLRGEVQGWGLASEGKIPRITPYAWWVSRWGLWPMGIAAALIVLFFAIKTRALRR